MKLEKSRAIFCAGWEYRALVKEDRSILWLNQVSEERQPHTEICSISQRGHQHHWKLKRSRTWEPSLVQPARSSAELQLYFASQTPAALSPFSIINVIPTVLPRLRGRWTQRHLYFWNFVMLIFLKLLTQMWFPSKTIEGPRFHSVLRLVLENIRKAREQQFSLLRRNTGDGLLCLTKCHAVMSVI